MSELKLQDTVIEIKDLEARAKSLDDDAQDDVFGGYSGSMARRRAMWRRAMMRRRAAMMRGRYGRRGRPRRRVPVYAWRRVQVGWRVV